MKLRLGIIDPYDGDRDPGDWALAIDFEWFSRDGQGGGKKGFRGFSLTFFRWTLIVGQEIGEL